MHLERSEPVAAEVQKAQLGHATQAVAEVGELTAGDGGAARQEELGHVRC